MISEQWQTKLETLREKFNNALNKQWHEWEIPQDADKAWPEAAKTLHAEWWEARIARQKEIDASIAAKAEFEYLYDKPYEDKRKVRVAGPFTVESLSPHRVLGVDENDELIDGARGIGERKKCPLKQGQGFPPSPSRNFSLCFRSSSSAGGRGKGARTEPSLRPFCLVGTEYRCAYNRERRSPTPPDPRERFAPCPAHLDARSLFVAFLSLLIGYWAVMNFVPVPEIGAASFEQGANLANWIDEQYLPGLKLREHDRHASNEQEQRKHGRCRGSAPTGAC